MTHYTTFLIACQEKDGTKFEGVDGDFLAGLFDFLLKIHEFLGVEELYQGDSKSVTEHLEGYDAGVLAFSVKNILDGGGRYRRLHRKPVDRHVFLPEQLQYSVLDCRVRVHFRTS